MSAPNAIPTAISHLTTFFVGQLGPFVAGNVYASQAPVGVPLPCIVWHSHDRGGRAESFIGQTIWTGEIAIRVFAASEAGASDVAIAIATSLPGRYTHADRTLRVLVTRPLPPIPASDSPIWAAGFLYTITIT